MEARDPNHQAADTQGLSAFAWWEKRRLLYNVIVGAAGILAIVFFTGFTFINIPGIILYGIIANLFYSLGFLLEMIARYYFRSTINFSPRRRMIFWTGVLFSIVVTLFMGWNIQREMEFLRD